MLTHYTEVFGNQTADLSIQEEVERFKSHKSSKPIGDSTRLGCALSVLVDCSSSPLVLHSLPPPDSTGRSADD